MRQAGRRQRIGEQRDALVHDVAPQQVIEPATFRALRRQGPGRRQALGQQQLGFLGQQQAAQTSGTVGERRRHCVLAI